MYIPCFHLFRKHLLGATICKALYMEGGQVIPLRAPPSRMPLWPGSESYTQADKLDPKQNVGSTVRTNQAWTPRDGVGILEAGASGQSRGMSRIWTSRYWREDISR